MKSGARIIENQETPSNIYNFDEFYIRPILIKQVPVVYPREAREQRLTGKVVVRVQIDERGFVVDATLLKSLHDVIETKIDKKGNIKIYSLKKSKQMTSLDEAALKSARLSRFKPAKHNKRPIKSYFNLPYTFVSM